MPTMGVRPNPIAVPSGGTGAKVAASIDALLEAGQPLGAVLASQFQPDLAAPQDFPLAEDGRDLAAWLAAQLALAGARSGAGSPAECAATVAAEQLRAFVSPGEAGLLTLLARAVHLGRAVGHWEAAEGARGGIVPMRAQRAAGPASGAARLPTRASRIAAIKKHWDAAEQEPTAELRWRKLRDLVSAEPGVGTVQSAESIQKLATQVHLRFAPRGRSLPGSV